MALSQVITAYITLVGDGVTSTFSLAVQNIPGASGVPSEVTITNPPIPVVSAVVDKSGLITVVFASPLENEKLVSLQLILSYGASSGLALATSSVIVNASTLGDNVAIAGVVGQTTRVQKLFLSCPVVNQSVVVKIKNGPSDASAPPILLGAIALDEASTPWFMASTGNDLIINLSSAVQVTGKLYYTQG